MPNQGFIGWSNPARSALIRRIVIGVDTAPVASVRFTDFAGFENLRLVIWGAGDTAATNSAVTLRFNDDASAIYDWSSFEWLGSNLSSSQGAVAATSAEIDRMPAATSLASTAGSSEIFIAAYASTAFHKTALGQSHYRTGTAVNLIQGDQYKAWWRSTAAITSITLTIAAGNFANGTRFSLYGDL